MMIASLRGTLQRLGEGCVVIDVNGVGYNVFCSNRTLSMLSEQQGEVYVLIETHVREDHIHLYGFFDEVEQNWFNLLNTVQGVGTKVCLAILSALPNEMLFRAIMSQDRDIITKAPGVGPKLATRIISELKDKIDNFGENSAKTYSSVATESTAISAQIKDDAISALVNLGYTRSDAYRAVSSSLQKLDSEVSVEIVIKESLTELSSND